MAEAKALLDAGIHGVMVGRAISHSPWEWRQVDSKIFGEVCGIFYMSACCCLLFFISLEVVDEQSITYSYPPLVCVG